MEMIRCFYLYLFILFQINRKSQTQKRKNGDFPEFISEVSFLIFPSGFSIFNLHTCLFGLSNQEEAILLLLDFTMNI